MRFRTTLLMIACLAVLAVVYGLTRNLGRPEPGRHLDPLITGSIEALRVERGGRSYELRRTPDGWEQTAPLWYPLTREAGQRLLTAATDLYPLEALRPGKDGGPTLAELALDPPGATVTVIGSDGAHEFRLGDITVSGTAYLRDDSGDTWLVPAPLHETIYGGTPEQWRRRTLPLPPAGALRDITRRFGGGTVTMRRVAERWGLASLPGNPRAAPAFLAGLERLAQRPWVEAFMPEEDAASPRYGLENPTLTLELREAGGSTTTLAVGRSADIEGRTVFAQVRAQGRATPVFTLPREAVDPLRVSAAALRDPRLFEAPADLVRGLRLERVGLAELSLEDRGTGLAVPEGWAALPEGLTPRALLDGVLGLTASRAIPAFATDARPVAILTLQWGVRTETKVALFHDGARWIAKRADDPAGYVLDQAGLDALPLPLSGP